MSSDPGTPARPPSIFVSYSSADRGAVRVLCQTLAKAGLDVWLDEEELAGGEAWDAKIRHQIRTCTYFMPVVSAATEARREGYFRREWRLAVERTLDLADDVMFLVPVVIDETRDHGARVPEKFLTVQWLRCPGGRETPQLVALAQRLAAEHGAAAVPAAVPPPVTTTPPKDGKARARIPAPVKPFPIFPAFPAPGQRLHFVYELVVWAGHVTVALWMRLPRALRYVATVVIVFKLIGLIFSGSGGSHHETDDERKARAATLEKILSEPKGPSNVPGPKILETAAALDALQTGRELALVRFAVANSSVADAAERVFSALHERIASGHDRQVAISLTPLPVGADDAAALARAAALKSRWIVVGTARPPGAMGEFTVELKLYDTTSQKMIWWAERSGDNDDAEAIGRKLADDLLEHVTFGPPAPPSAPADPGQTHG